jgi:hypothetical protein
MQSDSYLRSSEVLRPVGAIFLSSLNISLKSLSTLNQEDINKNLVSRKNVVNKLWEHYNIDHDNPNSNKMATLALEVLLQDLFSTYNENDYNKQNRTSSLDQSKGIL